MDILSRIHKNMYGLHLLNEVTQFVNKDDQPNNRFDNLYNRIVSAYPDEKNLYQDFYNKLLEFLKQDQSNKFKISYFDKKQFPKLIDIIHKLDNVLAQINRLKGVKIELNPNMNNIPKVYENKELGITVYRADNVFQAIELGKGTNFCISVGLNGRNYYYMYKYNTENGEQQATMYFVHSPNQEDPNKILAIDVRDNNSFLYTNTDNSDIEHDTYKIMVGDGGTSRDLMVIPEEVFKWVDQPISGLSDVELIEVAKIHTLAMQYIENPSEESQMAIVSKNPYTIAHINSPSEAVQLAAVSKNSYVIKYISNPSEAVQLTAVNINGDTLKYIENPSETVQLAAIRKYGYPIKYIEDPSEELQMVAVNISGYYIVYIEDPSEAVQLAAVTKNGDAIEHIKYPNQFIQLTAVKQNGHNIKWIENPSEAVQLAAVEQDGYPIQYIEDPSEKTQLVAVNVYGDVLKYIKNPSEQVQLAAVKRDRSAIQYIKNPSERVKLAAKLVNYLDIKD